MSIPLLNILCSVSIMVAISFDRHLSIVYQQHLTGTGVLKVVVVAWLFSILGTAPQLYEYSVYTKVHDEDNTTEVACGSEGIPEHFETIYASIILVIGYIIPLLLIIINYACVIVFIRQQIKISSLQNGEGKVSRAKVKIVGMLITIASVFAVCWAPFFVFFVKEEIMGTDDSSHANSIYHAVKQFFVALSTISNPFLYVTFSADFRRETVRLFTSMCKHGGSSVAPSLGPRASTSQLDSNQVVLTGARKLMPRSATST